MCGRFAVTTDPARLAQEIDAVDETGGSAVVPNYNVAPTTEIATVVARDDRRCIWLMHWGLLPSWVKGDAGGRPITKSPLINARAEKLSTSPAFRAAAAHQRCLVPMDGYYEWIPDADNPKARKTPFYMCREDGAPLLVAGLWSVWKPDKAADPLLSCTVVTTDAVGALARVHDRMPLVLAEGDWGRWLDPDAPVPADLLAEPPDISGLAMREVSTLVNKVANNGPELIAPADHGNQPVGLF
ncbi:MAG: SOS response-associated peptidase [Mycobacterium sp.]